MNPSLKTLGAWIGGFAAAVLLTGFVGVAMARISNPPASTAAVSAIGPTGQTSDGPTTTIATSTTGTDFTITGSGDTLTWNLPTASASNRGALSTTDWSTFNAKAGLALANVFTNLNTFANASSTLFSVNSTFWAGGSATTTIFSDGKVTVAGASTTPQRDFTFKAASAVECNLSDGATITFNLQTCNQARVTLGGNRALDFTNETQAMGQAIRLVVCQSTGSNTLTWDAAIRWAGGTAPTLTTTANKCDVLAGFTTAATGTPIILLDKILNF